MDGGWFWPMQANNPKQHYVISSISYGDLSLCKRWLYNGEQLSADEGPFDAECKKCRRRLQSIERRKAAQEGEDA